MPKKLVLFGATGQTGRHVLPMAVEAGHDVRCYVRSPDKIPTELRDNAQVEIVQGEFNDSDAVAAAIEGADFVICVGGGITATPGLMVEVTKSIVAGMRQHGVKRFTYQAGAFSPAPGTQNPFFVGWILRPVLGTIFGISQMLHDNDTLMAVLADDAQDLDWTVTRPGQIVDEPSTGELKVSDDMSSKCTFVDLARLTLDLAQSNDHVRMFPYVNY